MSIDRQLEQMFIAERRRTASIIGDVAELAERCGGDYLSLHEALTIVARHVEYGDENGTLYGECDRCRDYEGKRRRTEVPLGAETVPCAECNAILPFLR
jgi:hypothetical protein